MNTMPGRAAFVIAIAGAALCGVAAGPATPAAGDNARVIFRMHGSVEPVRSQPVFVPRLSGTGLNSVVITHLTRPGTRVRKGDLLVEFDSQAQIKTAGDREA